MIYAQIKDGIVVNRIVLDDVALEPLFIVGFDALIRIDQLDIQPDIGWCYDGNDFKPGEE